MNKYSRFPDFLYSFLNNYKIDHLDRKLRIIHENEIE